MREPVQPTPRTVTTPEAASTALSIARIGEGEGFGGGSGAGNGEGEGEGEGEPCLVAGGCITPPSLPPVPTFEPPVVEVPAAPKVIAPTVLSALRVAGDVDVQPNGADLTALARAAARATLDEALEGALGRRVVGRPTSSSAGSAPRAAARGGSRVKGEKRSPAELTRIQDKLIAFISASPGLRIEQINEALGTSTTDLALPLRKLVGDGALKTEGQRRATKYFPGAGQRSAPRRGRKKKS